MRDETIIKIIAVVCLTAICSVALLRGIDSALVSVVSSVIGGVAGYEVGLLKKKAGRAGYARERGG